MTSRMLSHQLNRYKTIVLFITQYAYSGNLNMHNKLEYSTASYLRSLILLFCTTIALRYCDMWMYSRDKGPWPFERKPLHIDFMQTSVKQKSTTGSTNKGNQCLTIWQSCATKPRNLWTSLTYNCNYLWCFLKVWLFWVMAVCISQLIRVGQNRILSCFICQSLKILKLYHGSKLSLAFYIMSSHASSQGY